jgi:GntR family transcriptional regulator, rspAB operon transcriptional repressor
MNISIYNTIKQRILFFKYAPGEMLNEKELAQEFGVSRTPVRETLLRLEWEKLVTIIPRAGIMVSKVEFQQLREVFQTRAPLEGLLARLATAQMNDGHYGKLEEIRKEAEAILVTRSRRSLLEVDMKFRDIIHDAAKNNSLRETSDYLYYQTQRLWHLIFDKMDFNLLVQDETEYMKRSIVTFKEKNLDLAEAYRKEVIFTDLNRVRNIFEFSY